MMDPSSSTLPEPLPGPFFPAGSWGRAWQAGGRGRRDARLADPPAGLQHPPRVPASLTQASGSRAHHASFRDPVPLGNLVWP